MMMTTKKTKTICCNGFCLSSISPKYQLLLLVEVVLVLLNLCDNHHNYHPLQSFVCLPKTHAFPIGTPLSQYPSSTKNFIQHRISTAFQLHPKQQQQQQQQQYPQYQQYKPLQKYQKYQDKKLFVLNLTPNNNNYNINTYENNKSYNNHWKGDHGFTTTYKRQPTGRATRALHLSEKSSDHKEGDSDKESTNMIVTKAVAKDDSNKNVDEEMKQVTSSSKSANETSEKGFISSLWSRVGSVAGRRKPTSTTTTATNAVSDYVSTTSTSNSSSGIIPEESDEKTLSLGTTSSSTSTETIPSLVIAQVKDATDVTEISSTSSNANNVTKDVEHIVVDALSGSANSNKKATMLSPQEVAAKLRADAARARLEAERMDAELTLKKIARLEKELEKAAAMAKSSTSTKGKDSKSILATTEQLQREMEALQVKLLPKPIEKPAVVKVSTSISSNTGNSMNSMTSNVEDRGQQGPLVAEVQLFSPENPEEREELVRILEQTPESVRQVLARIFHPKDTDDNEDYTKTKVLATQLEQMIKVITQSKKTAPEFTSGQIEQRKKELILQFENSSASTEVLSPLLKQLFRRRQRQQKEDNNDTDIDSNYNMTDFTLLVLEYEYYSSSAATTSTTPLEQQQQVVRDGSFNIPKGTLTASSVSDESPMDFLQPLLDGLKNETELSSLLVDRVIETWYPKCTRKETSTEPTLAQVNLLIANVLPRAGFQVSSASKQKPERVLGGYIIRGSLVASKTTDSKGSSETAGNVFISKLDALMSSAGNSGGGVPLSSQMTVLYTDDFTVFRDFEAAGENFDYDDVPSILYVTAPDIVRDPKPVQLSIVSALGIATSWYLSLYPFLLNPNVAKRVDEQIALADASMTPDLAFLTDLSLPLFTSFIAIQLIHELGHVFAASANNVTTSAPTFVPSIITGITSSVTTFRSLPKTRSAMFDFAVSGPLAGMIASIACIAVGSELTAALSALGDGATSLLPALPLEVLRQSTLGGGIIESVMGNGVLTLPSGAVGTGMTVPLHPVAIAGFIGLVVNALSLLPIGTTDGGRVAMALFGRGGKLILGQFFLVSTLVIGLLGSDLFLFYFAFLIAFQTGNEVPARNEVDSIDLPRSVLATAVYVLAILSLVPFQ